MWSISHRPVAVGPRTPFAPLDLVGSEAEEVVAMFYGRLVEVLLDWLETRRFPREELRVRTAIAAIFAVVGLVLVIALIIHAQGG